MPVVFSNNTGRVSQINDKVAAGCLSLAVIEKNNPAESLSFQQHKTIITRVGVSSSGNFQFLHTIGNEVYIYVFGDRIGAITLTGLSFESSCSGSFNRGEDPLQPSDAREHGFESLYNWYKKNRVAVRQKPISVTIGRDTTFQGFVTGLNGDVQDVQNRTVTFQLTLATLPTRG
jgi:hypothetical protein